MRQATCSADLDNALKTARASIRPEFPRNTQICLFHHVEPFSLCHDVLDKSMSQLSVFHSALEQWLWGGGRRCAAGQL